MRNAKYVLLAAGVIASSVLIGGCGRGKAVATVNGDKISKEEFYSKLEKLQIPTPQGAQPAGAVVLNQLIDEKLIPQLAKEKNATPTDAQINEKIDLMKKEGALSQQALAQAGTTMDDVKQRLWLRQAYINIVSKGENASEKEAKDFYDRNVDQYKRPEQVQIAVIICKQKAKIDKAAELIKSGQEFTTVAQQMSENMITKNNGGIVGWVAREDKRIPDVIRKCAFDTRKGQTSAAFQIPGDKDQLWYILKSLDKRPAKTQQFNDVKKFIIEDIRVAKATSMDPRTQKPKVDFAKMLDTYRKQAKIQVDDKNYKSLVDKKGSATAQEGGQN